MFLKNAFTHYHNYKKKIANYTDTSESYSFLFNNFKSKLHVERFGDFSVKKFRNGEYVFSGLEKDRILKKVEELETLKANLRSKWLSLPKSMINPIFLRRILLHYYSMNKSVLNSYQQLYKVYGKNTPSKRTCYRWFKKFKNGNFVIENLKVGFAKKFKDDELQALINEGILKTQKSYANKLCVTQQSISYRLKNRKDLNLVTSTTTM